MTNEEIIKLTLQVLGQDSAEKMRRTLEDMKATYEVLDRTTGTYDVTMRHEEEQLDKVTRAAMEATQVHKYLAQSIAETTAPAAAATAVLTDLGGQRMAGGMGALGAAYGLQDVITVLSMGGGWSRALMSATNNITPMLIGLGMGGGLAGVAGLAATAVAALGPVIEGLGISLDTGIRQKVPDATDKMERLTKAIKEDKETIEDLTKKRDLDFWELQKYTEAVHKLNQAEQDLATARAARSVKPGESKAARERAGAFREAVQEYGGGERLIGSLREAGLSEKEAENLIQDAQGGAANAIRAIQRQLQGRRGQEITYISPEARAQQKAIDAFGAQGAKEDEEMARDRRRRDEQLRRQAQQGAEAAERQRDQNRRADEQRLQQDIALSRRVGKAAGQAPAAQDLAGGKIPLLPENGTAQQMINVMERTQAQLMMNQAKMPELKARMEARLRNLERIGQQLENLPMPSGFPR